MSALLVCLGLAVLGLIGTRTSILGAGQDSGAAVGVGWSQCASSSPAQVAKVDLRELAILRATLLRVRRWVAGRWYEGGTVEADSAWSDQEPRRLRASRLPGGLWPGGYEMRWWANRNRDDVGADAFLFASSRQARSFFEKASDPACHRSGVQPPAPRWPAGARNLVWINPDDALQHDVFLLRGQVVYRIVDVRAGPPPTSPPSAAPGQAGVAIADALACALPYSGCLLRLVHTAPRGILASDLSPSTKSLILPL
jgi:hypothetical protein